MAKLILVDDDPQVLETLTLLLALKGYETNSFHSAEELLGGSKAIACDCLLVDFGLLGINGCQLVRELRQRQVSVPVILLSGGDTSEIASLVESDPSVVFLPKPARGSQLIEAIESSINKAVASVPS